MLYVGRMTVNIIGWRSCWNIQNAFGIGSFSWYCFSFVLRASCFVLIIAAPPHTLESTLSRPKLKNAASPCIGKLIEWAKSSITRRLCFFAIGRIAFMFALLPNVC